jgi:RND superfamily putative drug exporter
MNAIPAVRTDVANVAKDIDATNNGLLSVDAFSYDISHAATSDLWRIIPVVLIIIAALLAILLRSLVAPWYLIATVGLSYLATLGFAMLVFVHFGNNPGLNFILPFLLFIFSMALGEDYNILVMSRIREEAGSHKALKAAITKAIGVTGTTVTSAGLILAGTFTVLGIVGGDSQVQQIGFAVAFGILLDTFFVRTLLVPSIAVMLGRWNWWPSKLSRQTEV